MDREADLARRRERAKRRYARLKAERASLPPKPCECGCGEMIPAINSDGLPGRFKLGHHSRAGYNEATRFKPGNDGRIGNDARRAQGTLGGPGDPHWRGGEWRVKGGYVRATLPPEEAALSPTALRHGASWSIPRSHRVWNRAHPDDLVQPGEQVHHLNGVTDDDRIENLAKMSRQAHEELHAPERRARARDGLGRFA
jgi:hypothetical protein